MSFEYPIKTLGCGHRNTIMYRFSQRQKPLPLRLRDLQQKLQFQKVTRSLPQPNHPKYKIPQGFQKRPNYSETRSSHLALKAQERQV